jgi:hypothetical protein
MPDTASAIELPPSFPMKINRDVLVAASEFACRDETRPHLCCVYLAPGRLVYASNGHQLVRFESVAAAAFDTFDVDIPAPIGICSGPLRSMMRRTKSASKSASPVCLSGVASKTKLGVDVDTMAIEWVAETWGGQMPEFEKVWPKDLAVKPFTLNVEYLKLLGSVTKACGSNTYVRLVGSEDGLGPVQWDVVDGHGRRRASVLIMPVRTDR